MVTTRESRSESGKQGLDRLALAFDDERAVANAGLVLASTLAGRLGIEQVVDETLELGERAGAARPGRKLLTLVCSALVAAIRSRMPTFCAAGRPSVCSATG